MPKAFGRYRSCLLSFFKILFSTFLVKKVFNSRFFRYIFSNFFLSKINQFLRFPIKMLNINSTRIAMLKKVSKIKSKGSL